MIFLHCICLIIVIVHEGIQGEEGCRQIIMFTVKTNVDDHSPDHVEVAKKDAAKRDAEDKNVSAHRIVTF